MIAAKNRIRENKEWWGSEEGGFIATRQIWEP